MQKLILLTFFSFFILSCTEKEKTYEELEAEVLCDVLPEIAKYELNQNENNFLPPPLEIDSLKFSKEKIQQLNKKRDEDWITFKLELKQKIVTSIKKIDEFKKYKYAVIDTLLSVNTSFNQDLKYEFDSLPQRKLNVKEFEKSNIDVVLVSYKDTFEGSVRNNEYLPLSGLSRVLIHKNGKAYFECNKMYYHYDIFCFFSDKENKWKIEKIIKVKPQNLDF
jgi:anion-transporting  ArsA/GET3 family ATPase